MKPQVYHVDAFTPHPFRGNSAGVVLHADGLSETQMQLIARELRHSETAFLLTSDDSDVRIRYFTPTVEVPICGHATVAAHYVRASVLGLGTTTVWQTSLAGRHRVDIHAEDNGYRISLEQGTPTFELPLEGPTRAAIIAALHLTEDDILPGLPLQIASTGHSKVMIPLKPEVDLDALSPDLSALIAISQHIGCNGFFPFQIRPGENATDGRMFSPAIGIVEDPVTGNANGPMGAWLVHHNLMAHDGKILHVQGHQGRALGRDGIVEVTVAIQDNQPQKVTITGAAVILFHAEWAIDFN
uniref:PhzF family isomerase n=1 Tax=Citrobacter freundii TaxID=546 RepID=UPI00129CD1FD|nr:PhzF family isomerase [Citrobacter freundii]